VQQLFRGNPANESLFYWDDDANTSAYIWDVGDDDVRTEGMGYGLMIAVQLDMRPEFDALYAWAKAHMQCTEPSDPRYGYFAWHCTTAGSKLDPNPASDGETWIVTALYFASHRWYETAGCEWHPPTCKHLPRLQVEIQLVRPNHCYHRYHR